MAVNVVSGPMNVPYQSTMSTSPASVLVPPPSPTCRATLAPFKFHADAEIHRLRRTLMLAAEKIVETSPQLAEAPGDVVVGLSMLGPSPKMRVYIGITPANPMHDPAVV